MFFSHQVFDDALLGDCPPANCHYGQFVSGNQPRLVFGVLRRDPLYAGASACTTPPEARGLMAQHSLMSLQFSRGSNEA
jgi:hypothetical protein